MKDFDHPNILTLVGITLDLENARPYIIMPFMENGDLLTYIRNEANTIDIKQIIKFAIEIAQGMNYLTSEQKIVHRDLAARNCILDDNYHVKVADFGLSRNISSKDYYRVQTMSNFPLRW